MLSTLSLKIFTTWSLISILLQYFSIVYSATLFHYIIGWLAALFNCCYSTVFSATLFIRLMLFDCQSFVLHLCMITTNSIGYLRLILIKVVSGAQVVLMLEQSRFDAYLAVDAVWKTASVPLRVCSAATSLLGLCAARPTSRLFLGPRALRFFIYCGDCARSAYLSSAT